MNNLLFILLMGGPAGGAAGGESGNPYSMLIMMGLLVVVFYFFMIRPQMKKQKDLKKFRTELSEGDKIVTIGGIYGKITKVKDDFVIIETEGNTKLKVSKNGLVKEAADLEQKK